MSSLRWKSFQDQLSDQPPRAPSSSQIWWPVEPSVKARPTHKRLFAIKSSLCSCKWSFCRSTSTTRSPHWPCSPYQDMFLPLFRESSSSRAARCSTILTIVTITITIYIKNWSNSSEKFWSQSEEMATDNLMAINKTVGFDNYNCQQDGGFL